MWTRAAAIVPLLLLAAPLRAQTATASWNQNPEPDVIGYKLSFGTVSHAYTTVVDVPGRVTSVVVTGLPIGTRTYFALQAYNATITGPYSVEVSFDVPGTDPCAYPLGSKAVLIFPTGKLNKTGTGGPGTIAYISFRTASPNSPIVFASIKANGVDVPDSIMTGDNLHASGSLWFTMPPGPATYVFSIFARNLAGCSREQSTGFTVTFP
ncbi:MAG: fibronectin type III domain-containing protein [Gemmatimonadota bacterium]